MISVTRPYIPPKEKFEKYLNDILQRGYFTNDGIYASKLEHNLQQYLGSPNINLCANGTLSLQLAIKALGFSGKKIITTPFSYVATVSALLWEECEPVFVDINPKSLCIEPESVEEKLTPDIAGILPVHVFGNACHVEGFDKLAQRYNIPILYDAAHAFGCEYKGKSLVAHGNCSIMSFHATKLFHTCEGGAIYSSNQKLHDILSLSRKFGHIDDSHICLGINAKISELHAAMGLCILPEVAQEIKLRHKISNVYDQLLTPLSFQRQEIREHVTYNFSYYPIIFEDEKITVLVKKALEKEKIFPRRYFYPSLNTLPYLRSNYKVPMPIAENISKRILCLPMYGTLTEVEIERIVSIIENTMK